MSVNRILSTTCRGTTLVLVALLLICLPQSRAHALGSLIFQDNFSGSLDRTVWNPFIAGNGGSGGGWPWNMQNSQGVPSSALSRENGYNLDYDLPSLVDSGIPGVGLGLEDKKGSSATGFTWSGSVICSYPNTHYTKTTGFTFTDAYVEVRAKMPAGTTDGDWSGIWFLAAPGSDVGEIDLIETGYLDGSANPDTVMASTLHYPTGTPRQAQVMTKTGENLSAAYHTYAMAYKSGQYIKIYLDSKLVASWTTNIPTGRCYIILSNGLASSGTSGWHSQVDSSTPSSDEMLVKYVRVYNLR